MTREENKNYIVDFLINRSPYKDYHFNKIKNHLYHSNPDVIYSAPVNPKYLEPISKEHNIILEDNVYDALETIDQYNIEHKKEVPFILYGYEDKHGNIIFDDIYCDFKKLKEASASFQNLEEFLHLRMQIFQMDNMKNKVICLGHTHPFSGRISFNYSISDLCCHMHYLQYRVFADLSYNNKIFSLMKSVTTDYNFIYFDLKTKTFQKAEKVYHKKKRKTFVPLDTFKNCED